MWRLPAVLSDAVISISLPVSRRTWHGVGSVRGSGFGDLPGSATVPPCQGGSSAASSSQEKRGVRTVPSVVLWPNHF